MTRVIEVRLKDKTTDEYIDVEPDTDRAGRLVDGIRHQHQLNDNGSLSVFREIYTARYSRYWRDYQDMEVQEVSLVGHYAPGQYTSFRETQREPWAGQRPDTD